MGGKGGQIVSKFLALQQVLARRFGHDFGVHKIGTKWDMEMDTNNRHVRLPKGGRTWESSHLYF